MNAKLFTFIQNGTALIKQSERAFLRGVKPFEKSNPFAVKRLKNRRNREQSSPRISPLSVESGIYWIFSLRFVLLEVFPTPTSSNKGLHINRNVNGEKEFKLPWKLHFPGAKADFNEKLQNLVDIFVLFLSMKWIYRLTQIYKFVLASPKIF